MELRLIQLVTEMCIRNISWVVKTASMWADNLTSFMCRLSLNLGASNFWSPLGTAWACRGIALPLVIDGRLLKTLMVA